MHGLASEARGVCRLVKAGVDTVAMKHNGPVGSKHVIPALD
jgi:hypothetical protein